MIDSVGHLIVWLWVDYAFAQHTDEGPVLKIIGWMI